MFGKKQKVRLYRFQGGLRTADEIRAELDELEKAYAEEQREKNG